MDGTKDQWTSEDGSNIDNNISPLRHHPTVLDQYSVGPSAEELYEDMLLAAADNDKEEAHWEAEAHRFLAEEALLLQDMEAAAEEATSDADLYEEMLLNAAALDKEEACWCAEVDAYFNDEEARLLHDYRGFYAAVLKEQAREVTEQHAARQTEAAWLMATPRLIRASNWHLVAEFADSTFEPPSRLGLELGRPSRISPMEAARREKNRVDWRAARDHWEAADSQRRTEAAEAAQLRRQEEAEALLADPRRIDASNWDIVEAFAPPDFPPPRFLPLGEECLGSSEELTRRTANHAAWCVARQRWMNAEHKLQQQRTAEELHQQQAAAALRLAEKATQERVVINERLQELRARHPTSHGSAEPSITLAACLNEQDEDEQWKRTLLCTVWEGREQRRAAKEQRTVDTQWHAAEKAAFIATFGRQAWYQSGRRPKLDRAEAGAVVGTLGEHWSSLMESTDGLKP